MTDQHPITPPPELVEKWDEEGTEMFRPAYQIHLTTRAAQWGADQELEACCRELEYNFMPDSGSLRAARRPKPASLKEQALKAAILELRDRVEALEAKDEDDKEAWAARLRRPGRSQAERIGSLVKRIEALEAAQPAKPNHPAKPDSSLVERVENAIYRSGNEPGFRAEARAAIRTVAAWMTTNPDHHFPPALVFALDKEAER